MVIGNFDVSSTAFLATKWYKYSKHNCINIMYEIALKHKATGR